MDEKRLVEHANDYIKQMAKGINPLTGETVSDSDLINNIKISRCLFYVSEILDRYTNIIDSGSKRKRRSKFNAQNSDFINFNYSTEPIYISILAKKINEHFNKDEMRKLSANSISNWLVSKGILESYTREDGKTSKKPTALGENLGIKSIEKQGQNGTYMINVYDINAQRFIVENIEDICKSL